MLIGQAGQEWGPQRSAGPDRRKSLASRELRLNDRIRVREVRVIDDKGEQLGVMATDQALQIAEQRGLDLVEVAPGASPPVTRILDYGKFKYEQSKRESEGRKKQARVLLREVKMKPNIGQHDLDFKARTAAKLLRAGDKVKITIRFRGREITHPQIGRDRIGAIMERLEADGVPLLVEKNFSMEGRFMSVIVAEDKVRAAALAKERAEAEAEAEAAAAAENDGDATANDTAATDQDTSSATAAAPGSGDEEEEQAVS